MKLEIIVEIKKTSIEEEKGNRAGKNKTVTERTSKAPRKLYKEIDSGCQKS